MIYTRTNKNTLFLLPCIAVGVDVETDLPFLEVAWLCWAIGVGSEITGEEK